MYRIHKELLEINTKKLNSVEKWTNEQAFHKKQYSD